MVYKKQDLTTVTESNTLETNKFCKYCNKHTLHKETK
ncbi:MAG: 50S ribosomal protein L33, partial [Tetragenococcus halophilus]|nr:50S ribosomal protein L33 [Tetragenococcus halophilus]